MCKAIGHQVSSSALYVDLAVLCVKVIRSLGSSNVVCVKAIGHQVSSSVLYVDLNCALC